MWDTANLSGFFKTAATTWREESRKMKSDRIFLPRTPPTLSCAVFEKEIRIRSGHPEETTSCGKLREK
jgi:hypothetical protein